MHSFFPSRPCAWRAPWRRSSASSRDCARIATSARMKYLFLKEGWTAESFLAELQSRLDFTLLPGVPEQVPDDIFRDHAGIHPQRQPGLSYVGASVLRGRLTGDQLLAAAELAERFGSGALRTTVSQNLIFIDIPNQKTAELAQRTEARSACKWKDRTSGAAPSPARALSSASWRSRRPRALRAGWWMSWKSGCREFDQQLGCNVTGCPNSCGQHWIADIGIEGKKIKHEGKLTDAYYFCLGGAVGQHAAIARPVGLSLPRAAGAGGDRAAAAPLSGRRASRKRICAPGSAATTQRRTARASGRRRFWSRSSAICPPAACRMRVAE